MVVQQEISRKLLLRLVDHKVVKLNNNLITNLYSLSPVPAQLLNKKQDTLYDYVVLVYGRLAGKASSGGK